MLVKYVYVFVFSEKQAVNIPDELFDAAEDQGITTVNFSKNQLTAIPSRYTNAHNHTHNHIHTYTHRWWCCHYHCVAEINPWSTAKCWEH